jgi:small subunit ribosomal protein S15
MSELQEKADLSSIDQETIRMLEKYRLHENDTGSPYYLMIVLTGRIKMLSSAHVSKHKKDYSAKRTIVRLVAQRRTCQRYMQSKYKYREDYAAFMAELGLRV